MSAAAAAARRGVAAAPRRLSILGATGSIGTSTLAVLEQQRAAFTVEAVTANSNAAKLAAIARQTGARVAAIAEPSAYGELKAALAGTAIVPMAGPDAVVEAAGRPADLVVAAIVGAAGLAPTMAAVRAGATIALANKECLVSAGTLFMAAARRNGVHVLPVDSEHNAIFQLIEHRDVAAIERITVTASGGPFRTWTTEQMGAATPADALRHPTWSMGAKITIDSATLMNKGLELIEAHHLFDQPSEKLAVLVHPQSIVHGLVAMRDGYVLAALSPPDMRTPIANCLAWPESSRAAVRSLDLAAIAKLEFEEPDSARFPALRLAQEALETGGWATNMLSAANEIAVAAFLGGTVGFLEIAGIVEDTLGRAAGSLQRDPTTVEEALTLDGHARRLASDLVTQYARRH